ncbi:methylated-DNA--protein-cysteine methyltransferase isoform X7 [Anas platyrhynchos]|uniref:methylated-DNA--protein-cysteine methyltransferase isoform X7 n=1 Tax=Anas platyrhynchos TaxID=8839 RepID=UPI003AF2BE81
MLIANLCRDRDLSSSMASRRVPKGRGVGGLRGVRRCGGDDGAAEAVHGLAARLLLRASKDRAAARAPLPPPPAPARFVHQAGFVDPAERCEIWRGHLLPEISGPSRQQQSCKSSGRSNEEQSYPDYNTVPQGDSQQRADRQLRRREPHERVAFVAREAPEREVSILMRLSHSCSTAKAHSRGYLAYNKLSEHPAEFRKMQNDYSGPGLLCVYFVPIPSPVLFYF